MVRRLLRDSAIYAGAGLISQAIAFVLFPFLAHALHPRDYGVIDIVGVLTTLALLSVALEINQGLGRMVAIEADADERSTYASTALIWSVGSYTVMAVAALVFARPLAHALLGSHVNIWIFRAAIGSIWFGGALYLVQDQLRWQRRAMAFAAVSVTVALTTTGATAVYVFVLHGGALGVVAGQLTGVAAGLVPALALSPGVYRLRFDWQRARTMLVFSAPLVPSSLGVLLNGYADRLAIQHERSLAAVGLYGVGFRISVVVTVLLMGVQGSVIPAVVARHAEPETPAVLERSFRMFWSLGCAAFIALSLLAEPAVRLLSSPAYFGGARVVPFLVSATFLAGLYSFAPGPTIAGRTRSYALVNVAAGLINLGLAFGLVPSLGIVGAGVATLTSSALGFAATMYVSQRLYPVPHSWPRLLSAAGVSVLVVVLTRSLLVIDRVAALGFTSIVARAAIAVIGGGAVLAMLVDREELRKVRPRARPRPV